MSMDQVSYKVDTMDCDEDTGRELVRNSNGVQKPKKKKKKRRLSATRETMASLMMDLAQSEEEEEEEKMDVDTSEPPQNEQKDQKEESKPPKEQMVSRRRRKRHSLSSNAIKKSIKNPTKKLFESLLHGTESEAKDRSPFDEAPSVKRTYNR